MKQNRSGCLSGGCLTLVIGILLGMALTLGILLVWAILQPADRTPLTNHLEPGDLDLEVTISEAYLNQAVAQNLAARQEGDPLSIILDFHQEGRVEASLEGFVHILGLDTLSPVLDAELSLGVRDGELAVRIERVGVGALQIQRDSMPAIAEPALQSVEEAIEAALIEQLVPAGYQIVGIASDEDSMTLGFRRQ